MGIDIEEEYIEISKKRKFEIENEELFNKYRNKLQGFKKSKQLELYLLKESMVEYKTELDFNKYKNK